MCHYYWTNFYPIVCPRTKASLSASADHNGDKWTDERSPYQYQFIRVVPSGQIKEGEERILNHKFQTSDTQPSIRSFSSLVSLALRFILVQAQRGERERGAEQRKSDMAATASLKSSLRLPSPISDFSSAAVSVSPQVTNRQNRNALCWLSRREWIPACR